MCSLLYISSKQLQKDQVLSTLIAIEYQTNPVLFRRVSRQLQIELLPLGLVSGTVLNVFDLNLD